MLLFRQKVSEAWLAQALANPDPLLVDHAHLERKAATSAINLEKYRHLFPHLRELNAIAIEELQHFALLLDVLERRSVPFAEPHPSPWIKGLMRAIRPGVQGQVIDHLLVCALIEGRSCEKFQMLAVGFATRDPELAELYRSLVESEGNHYATYLLMARGIDEEEADRRLDWFLDLEAELARQPNPRVMLH